ncbi:Ig-like domain-containing protein [Serratia sp. UGAL515B_01]|uniref:Ig-like domain-containing protein n=1 Tax=Serratia sp. UGAL515B_01 TaxID=2986763 RepID=UPI002953DA61|nr:Ig-like domain-containing protein [Serratia sp. UGAL515B_01]WON77902.1 Ig-like domain-containing protein [Serratia sp. UGAL515B_01]
MMTSVCGLRKVTSWLLIFAQLITPVLSMVPAAVRADVPPEMQSTISGLDTLIFGDNPLSPSLPAAPTSDAKKNEQMPSFPPAEKSGGYTTSPLPTSEKTDKSGNSVPSFADSDRLPDLPYPMSDSGSPTVEPKQNTQLGKFAISNNNNDEPTNSLASGAMQVGSLLSSENKAEATINYARSIGEGLINQQVNDWLNQFGNAKVSFGTDKKISGDILIPLHDSVQNILFSQIGTRHSQDRNTANLGLGYRQYLNDWLLGVNTFYDYDYTGKNRRLGVGGEAWRNYLKLAVNGYIRLTNWHQSVLQAMEDYDERPANGFDIRAEGYVPTWPNLGGSLKYEQYLGKGISVSDNASPNSLKENPMVLTAGLNYTPFPLMTLSASRSVGNSNNTHLGLDINYRLGVPWYRQISPDSVDLMRSLAGNKYDLVDRNYNIVMQYRKQDLLHIQLPARQNVQALETTIISLNVSRAKHGLKSVDWSVSPEFTRDGGQYRILSPTQLQITLPAYVFTRRAVSNYSLAQHDEIPQEYQISAVATDNNGNQSNKAVMMLGLVPSDNVVGSLTLAPNDHQQPANNTAAYAVTAIVKDVDNKPLAGQTITFSVDGLTDIKGEPGTQLNSVDNSVPSDPRQLMVTTKTDGKAVVQLRSRIAGKGNITATMANGNFRKVPLSFAGDSATATVREIWLDDKVTNKVANGKNAFTFSAVVRDANDNPVANETVTWSKNRGDVTLSPVIGVTDGEGRVKVQLLSSTKAVDGILLSARTGNQASQVMADKQVSFTAATIGSVVLSDSENSKVADGKSSFTYLVKVIDGGGNPVSDMPITAVADKKEVNVTVKSVTDNNGQATVTMQSTTAASDITLSAMTGNEGAPVAADRKVNFIAGAVSPGKSTFSALPEGIVADDKSMSILTLTLKDENGNAVRGQADALSAAVTGVTGTKVTGFTEVSAGNYTAMLTGSVAGKVAVAAVHGAEKASNNVPNVTLTADSKTATIRNEYFTADSGAKADGKGSNLVKVVVTDALGNLVAGQTVTFAVTKGDAQLTQTKVITGPDGVAQTSLFSTVAGDNLLTASLNGVTTKEISSIFIADSSTATLTELKVMQDNALANGTAMDRVRLMVKDANGNVLSGQTVTLMADQGATVAKSATTDQNGMAMVMLTSTKAGASMVTAILGGSQKSAEVHFRADARTAKVATLAIIQDNALANGKATDRIQLTVTDAQGNALNGQTVILATDQVAVIDKSVTTGEDGKATTTLNSTVAGVIKVTATLGSSQQTVEAHFKADVSTAKVAALAITQDNALANGKATNHLQLTVTDAQGNVLSGQTVTLAADHGAAIVQNVTTDEDGKATATLSSTMAGTVKVTAVLGASQQTVEAHFKADASTAKVAALTITQDNALANGKATNRLQLTVTDVQGNALNGQQVELVADGGATVVKSVTTGENGTATATLSSTMAGVIKVTATLGASQQTVEAHFKADVSTAKVAALAVIQDNALADGKTTNRIEITVTDALGNMLSGQAVTLAADRDATLVKSVTTDEDGKASATLSSTAAGVIKVTATLGASQQMVEAHFKADVSTAKVAALMVTQDNGLANGKATNRLQLMVTDAQGNALHGQTVALAADQGAMIDKSVSTGEDGKATTTLSSTMAGTVKVTATLGTSQQIVEAHFRADSSTAKVTAIVVTQDNALANGKATNRLQLTVTDAQGNALNGQTVTLSADQGATIAKNVITGENGTATTTLSSTVAGTVKVTATLGDSQQTVEAHFRADSSTAKVATLAVTQDNALANGKATNSVQLMVTDARGNALNGQTVTLTTEQGATIAKSVITAEDGKATATLSSTVAGVIKVTATLGESQQTTDTHFIADSSTAKVAALLVTQDNVLANGKATNTIQLMVTDAQGNALNGQTVMLATEQGATIAKSVITGEDGKATATLSSTLAGIIKVTATLGDGKQTVETHFKADASTAVVSTVTLNGTDVTQPANGTISFMYTVKVVDANGNPVPDVDVRVSTDKSVSITTSNHKTDAQGQLQTGIGNIKAWNDVTLSAMTDNQLTPVAADKKVSFVADAVSPKDSTFTISQVRIMANGQDQAVLSLALKDKNANAVSGIGNALKAVVSGVSDTSVTDFTEGEPGSYTARLSGTTTGTAMVTIMQGSDQIDLREQNLTLFNYNFAIAPSVVRVVIGGKHQFSVVATASDTKAVETVASGTTWTSSATAIATVDTAAIATGKEEGNVSIEAKGTYKGFDYKETAELQVKSPRTSDEYGNKRSGDIADKFIVEPPSYSLYASGGAYVDAIGTTERQIGGSGGGAITIPNLNSVDKVSVKISHTNESWNKEQGVDVVSKLVFHFRDGRTMTVGGGADRGDPSPKEYDVSVPEGYILQGYDVAGSRAGYLHTIKFIFMPVLDDKAR